MSEQIDYKKLYEDLNKRVKRLYVTYTISPTDFSYYDSDQIFGMVKEKLTHSFAECLAENGMFKLVQQKEINGDITLAMSLNVLVPKTNNSRGKHSK